MSDAKRPDTSWDAFEAWARADLARHEPVDEVAILGAPVATHEEVHAGTDSSRPIRTMFGGEFLRVTVDREDTLVQHPRIIDVVRAEQERAMADPEPEPGVCTGCGKADCPHLVRILAEYAEPAPVAEVLPFPERPHPFEDWHPDFIACSEAGCDRTLSAIGNGRLTRGMVEGMGWKVWPNDDARLRPWTYCADHP